MNLFLRQDSDRELMSLRKDPNQFQVFGGFFNPSLPLSLLDFDNEKTHDMVLNRMHSKKLQISIEPQESVSLPYQKNQGFGKPSDESSLDMSSLIGSHEPHSDD